MKPASRAETPQEAYSHDCMTFSSTLELVNKARNSKNALDLVETRLAANSPPDRNYAAKNMRVPLVATEDDEPRIDQLASRFS